jgi:flagellar hook-length control protein FliK
LQSHVLYTNGTVSATFWADQQQTLRMVNDELPKLRKGLQDWGITVGDIAVRKGQPPSPKNPISHQLLDERV